VSDTSVTHDEPLDAFRLRVREWLRANVRPLSELSAAERDSDNPAVVARSRAVQRMLFDAGLAGLVFPREYGGQGLPPEYQRAYAEEAKDYEQAFIFQEPTLNILAPTLLDFGTEQQKRDHLPAILRGDERWVQFLSEPSSGSDVASTMTTAGRVDGGWLLNGSKIWSSAADRSDWAMCPARTNWDVPKHHGLTMFLVPIQQRGIDVHRIRTADGNAHFCQEFLTDVFVADHDVLGEVDRGWSVILALIGHERLAVGGASPFTGGTRPMPMRGPNRDLLHLAQRCGRDRDPVVRRVVGEDYAVSVVKEQLSKRVVAALRDGDLPDTAGAMLRLFEGLASRDHATAARDIAGHAVATAAGRDEIATIGEQFLMRQASCIGGGTVEMARNAIAERMLGMPRELASDRGVPFRDVVQGTPSND
jgi:alkylation response protein AidB-like acyl-CoA dehydrogenase